ncbi:MAG: alkaline phosphatase family protein [Planctomycetota bacterium]
MSEAPGAPNRAARRVLLVGWDGADWRMINPLVEQGLMPNTKRFVEQGVMGNVASLTPMLSPILWTSIATGKHADKHGILGFAEPDPVTGKVRPVAATSRTCKALWNILSEQGLTPPSGSTGSSSPTASFPLWAPRTSHGPCRRDQCIPSPWSKRWARCVSIPPTRHRSSCASSFRCCVTSIRRGTKT